MVLPLDVVEGAGGEDLNLRMIAKEFGDEPAVILGPPGDFEAVALDHETEFEFSGHRGLARTWASRTLSGPPGIQAPVRAS